MKAAFRLANRQIANAMADSADLRGMATTASAVLAGDDAARASRTSATAAIYAAAATARCAQVTDDHSWVEEQVRAGTMSASAARQHPWRNVVTRALSGGGDPEIDIVELDAAAGRALPALLGRPVGRRAARDDRAISSARTTADSRASASGSIAAANAGRRARQHHRRSCSKSMLHNLAQLPRYRGLIQSLVARELKARYRGSVLGFFWSFINPLTLLLIYIVRLHVRHAGSRDPKASSRYALFMFCGILPWTWFASSLHGVVGRADLRRQPDQEGAVPGGDPADRHRDWRT